MPSFVAVQIWRPLTATANSLYVYEVRVLRAVASASCQGCRQVAIPVNAAAYSTTPDSAQTYTQLIDGQYAPAASTPMRLKASSSISTHFGTLTAVATWAACQGSTL